MDRYFTTGKKNLEIQSFLSHNSKGSLFIKAKRRKKMKKRQLIAAAIIGISLLWTSPTKFNAAEMDTTKVVEAAHELTGINYVSGGETKTEGFDSSGFIYYVVETALNVDMPRTLEGQSALGTEVNKSDLKAGDLLFFSTNSPSLTSAAIYMGDGQMIFPSTSKGEVVKESFKDSAFWNEHFVKAKRLSASTFSFSDYKIVSESREQLGVSYQFGAESPEDGFDCSGFIQYVFKEAYNAALPRSTDQQWKFGTYVKKEDLQVGDVVFFEDTYRSGISHAGVYIGKNRMIHAKHKEGVTVDYLTDKYWQDKYAGAKRMR